MKQYWGEIKDPILGYVYITEAEKEIIDSYPVQRLRRIRQLAGAEYVYPGANHTRFEHCVGVMHLAGLMIKNPFLSHFFSEEDYQMIRIAALLHDVGHGPFSHIFEHLLVKFLKKTHEDINMWIVQKSELKDIIGKLGFDPDSMARLSVGCLHKPGRAFMDQTIRSAIDVDKLDFVVRDTYHTGAQYGYVDVFRLIHTLDILDQNLAIDIGALSALESFILARIESFKSIYFHRVGRAVQLMLIMAMEEAKDELGLVSFKTPEEYLEYDDYTVWAMLKQSKKSRRIIENLEKRKLLKCAYDQTFYVRDKAISSIFSVEEIRNKLRDQIASEARVKPEDVIIDVPTLPSVPYSHSVLLEPLEIPIFQRTRDGVKISQRLNEISGIFDVLKGFINILRVYTTEENREKITATASKLLSETPSSAKISF
jgi:HD superfamily phosphohydrolase